MAKSANQPKRMPEQVFAEISERAAEYYAASSDSQKRISLQQQLDALVEEYRNLTSERIIY